MKKCIEKNKGKEKKTSNIVIARRARKKMRWEQGGKQQDSYDNEGHHHVTFKGSSSPHTRLASRTSSLCRRHQQHIIFSSLMPLRTLYFITSPASLTPFPSRSPCLCLSSCFPSCHSLYLSSPLLYPPPSDPPTRSSSESRLSLPQPPTALRSRGERKHEGVGAGSAP